MRIYASRCKPRDGIFWLCSRSEFGTNSTSSPIRYIENRLRTFRAPHLFIWWKWLKLKASSIPAQHYPFWRIQTTTPVPAPAQHSRGVPAPASFTSSSMRYFPHRHSSCQGDQICVFWIRPWRKLAPKNSPNESNLRRCHDLFVPKSPLLEL